MTKPKDADEGFDQINCYRALPHELFVWCVENGMPEGECQTAKEQIKWIKWYAQRLRNKVDEAEYIKRRFCDVVPMLTSRSWEDIWERCRDAFKSR